MLAEAGYRPLILDNFSNSKTSVIDRLTTLLGARPTCIEGDIRDADLLKKIFETYTCIGVIHLAGVKAVGESVEQPLEYYQMNVSGSLTLFRALQEHGVKKIIFSSSAAVYGEKSQELLDEHAPLNPMNPYGRSKLMVEEILEDIYRAEPDFSICKLRWSTPEWTHWREPKWDSKQPDALHDRGGSRIA